MLNHLCSLFGKEFQKFDLLKTHILLAYFRCREANTLHVNCVVFYYCFLNNLESSAAI